LAQSARVLCDSACDRALVVHVWEPGRVPAWDAPVRDPVGRPVMLYVDTIEAHAVRWRARGIDAETIRRALNAISHRQVDPYVGPDEDERTRWYAPGFGRRAWLRVVVAYWDERGNVVTGVAVGTLPLDARRA